MLHSMFQRCGITPAQVLGIASDRLNARVHAEFLLASEELALEADARGREEHEPCNAGHLGAVQRPGIAGV